MRGGGGGRSGFFFGEGKGTFSWVLFFIPFNGEFRVGSGFSLLRS